jgi:hypothetical protein
MLEQLFGSKTRVKLLKFFLENPKKKFYVRELTRLTDSLINSIRRELLNLTSVGLLEEIEGDNSDQETCSGGVMPKSAKPKKFYRLNKNSLFLGEFEGLFFKGKLLAEKDFAEKLKKIGVVAYLALSGFFVGDPVAAVDMIVIGSFEKKKIHETIKEFEGSIGRPINYTLMDTKEYRMRREISDRFLTKILDNPKNLIIVNELKSLTL